MIVHEDPKPLVFFIHRKHRIFDKADSLAKHSIVCLPVNLQTSSDSASQFGFSSIRIGRDITTNLEKAHQQLAVCASLDAEALELPFFIVKR